MQLSKFGLKLGGSSGIQELMDDLGQAMAAGDVIMMGGGNPAHIPAVEAVWRDRINEILADGDALERMLGNYDTPRGNTPFLEILAGFFRRQLDWEITADNIAMVNGSQNGFFFLFNMLAGEMNDGTFKKILLPLCPEYIGYADQGICDDLFVSRRPLIEELPGNRFKYRVDLENLEVDDSIAAICVSRPTNPTGNVLDDSEMEGLAKIAAEHNIPLMVDSAYGIPFPGIIYSEATPFYNENTIISMSLSKLGLPATRSGIIIASTEIISALSAVNAVVSLATGGIGQTLTAPLFENDTIMQLANKTVRPFYEQRSLQTQQWIDGCFGERFPYRIHLSQGAIFLWLWFPGLPGGDKALYERLKQRGVLVIPGPYFFPGLDGTWQHSRECIRITYSQNMNALQEGITIIGEEVEKMFAAG